MAAVHFIFFHTNPGQVYSINTEVALPYRPPKYGIFGDGGKTNKTHEKTFVG